MRIREAARTILLDKDNNVLLIKIEDDTVHNPDEAPFKSFWVTPGGGLESNEGFEEAASRELWEETGIKVKKEELGPWVWTRNKELDWKGEMIQSHERFFVVRVTNAKVILDNLTDNEREVYRSYKWWSIDELENTNQKVIPQELCSLLKPLVNGAYPEDPIIIA